MSSTTHKQNTSIRENLKERRNVQLRVQKQLTQMNRKTLNISPFRKTPVIKPRIINDSGREAIKDIQRGYV